jgi:hypothetical protein
MNGGGFKRYCEVCNTPIPAHSFDSRMPENKVNLCKPHLISKHIKERRKIKEAFRDNILAIDFKF